MITLKFIIILRRTDVLNGIPALFLYKKGNTNLIADESITGANSQALENFFSKVI